MLGHHQVTAVHWCSRCANSAACCAAFVSAIQWGHCLCARKPGLANFALLSSVGPSVVENLGAYAEQSRCRVGHALLCGIACAKHVIVGCPPKAAE